MLNHPHFLLIPLTRRMFHSPLSGEPLLRRTVDVSLIATNLFKSTGNLFLSNITYSERNYVHTIMSFSNTLDDEYEVSDHIVFDCLVKTNLQWWVNENHWNYCLKKYHEGPKTYSVYQVREYFSHSIKFISVTYILLLPYWCLESCELSNS